MYRANLASGMTPEAEEAVLGLKEVKRLDTEEEAEGVLEDEEEVWGREWMDHDNHSISPILAEFWRILTMG